MELNIWFIYFYSLFKVEASKSINFTLSTFESGSLNSALATSYKFRRVILVYHFFGHYFPQGFQ